MKNYENGFLGVFKCAEYESDVRFYKFKMAYLKWPMEM